MAYHKSVQSSGSSYSRGLDAEIRAQTFLRGKSYDIIAQRYRNEAGEIDIIAKRGNHLAFVEVKKRKTYDEAAYAIQPRQQKRIAHAAEGYLAQNLEFWDCTASFDVVLVSAGNSCIHIEHAFMMN